VYEIARKNYEEDATMNTTSTKHGAVSIMVLLTVLSIQPMLPAQAADPQVKGAEGSVPVGERSIQTSGIAENTIKACMARIPEVATAGQRMLAEQSCAAEEDVRKAIRSARTF
jgi:hypothetical protein